MVGRLVEQQHVGLLQQNLRQFDTHTPASGEFAGGTLEVGSHKSQSDECAFYLCLIVICPHHLIAFMLLGEALHQGQIVVALIIGTLSQLLVHLVNALLHLPDIGECLLSLLPDGGIVLQVHHLRQIADSSVGRHADHTTGGLLLSAKYFQECRFPSAVLTHQGNTVTIVHHKTGIGEQRLSTEFYT